SASFALMILAAQREGQPTSVGLAMKTLPAGIEEQGGKLQEAALAEGEDEKHVYHAGRLTWDPAAETLHLKGVLPDTERDRIVRDTAPQDFKDLVAALQKITAAAKKEPSRVTVEKVADVRANFPKGDPEYNKETKTLKVTVALPLEVYLPTVPPGFDIRYAG